MEREASGCHVIRLLVIEKITRGKTYNASWRLLKGINKKCFSFVSFFCLATLKFFFFCQPFFSSSSDFFFFFEYTFFLFTEISISVFHSNCQIENPPDFYFILKRGKIYL